ncbi:MAG: phenylalanine--tRNA ligase subunit beta [Acidobacteriales bacterium]|nr:phenylalanine--tRNA ligase subunit beta [Terriglobales bacterium]
MKISPKWLREFVDLKVDDRKLAEDLTLSGINVEKVSGSVFEMDITTNRVDAMNHYGTAREAAAIYDLDLKPLTARLPKATGKSGISVRIDVPESCARFTGQEIRGMKIGPAQSRVQKRFTELEQKPINNAADATNYVLLMIGKPTHAFDADKLAGGQIIVRLAKPGESLKTLDGVERKLHPEDVVVADAQKPVALAGVMGGWGTMITDSTKNVFIESAWWDPAAIRRTARRHGMHTDASHRFERGADWAACDISTDLVSELILESGGGQLSGEKIDVIARKVGHPPVRLNIVEVKRVLGKDISEQEVRRILTRLGFSLSDTGPSLYTVEIPTWRLDVEREIDLIEEIARIHGYDQFPSTLPSFAGGVVELPHAAQEEKVRRTLLSLGYHEALSNTFVAKEDSLRFSPRAVVGIANPLSEEASAMRTTLVPGMLDMLAHNLNRDAQDVRLFEYGHIYAMQGASTDESASLCMGVTAGALESILKDSTEIFRVLKGDMEDLLAPFEGTVTFKAEAPAWLHPGRGASVLVNGTAIGHFGQLHPEVATARKLKQDVYVAEVAIDSLFERPLHVPRYTKLSRFPAVERDFSFLCDDATSWAQVSAAVHDLTIAELQRLAPAEIFRGGSVPAGKYSLLLRAWFQSHDRTLREDELASWSEKIIAALMRLGGNLRK